MKIILAQIEIANTYKKNLIKILQIIQQNKFDLLVFPEMALTGYNLKEVFKISNKKIKKGIAAIQNIMQKDQIVVIGTKKEVGGIVYNSAAIISKYKINYYHKNTLTEYDSSYFHAGENIFVLDYKNEKIGFLICRDQNNNDLIAKYKTNKCSILIQLSAHYYNPTKAIKNLDKNTAMSVVRAIDSNSLFCKVNVVGKRKKKISVGGSMIVTKYGYICRRANLMDEELIKFNTKDRLW